MIPKQFILQFTSPTNNIYFLSSFSQNGHHSLLQTCFPLSPQFTSKSVTYRKVPQDQIGDTIIIQPVQMLNPSLFVSYYLIYTQYSLLYECVNITNVLYVQLVMIFYCLISLCSLYCTGHILIYEAQNKKYKSLFGCVSYNHKVNYFLAN